MDLIAILFLFNSKEFISPNQKKKKTAPRRENECEILFRLFLFIYTSGASWSRVPRWCARYIFLWIFFRRFHVNRKKKNVFFSLVRDFVREVETELIKNGWPYRDTYLTRCSIPPILILPFCLSFRRTHSILNSLNCLVESAHVTEEPKTKKK